MKISVITPSLNSIRFIEQTIQNVLDQNYADFEHIVVDGGSVDGTVDVLKKYPHLQWISEPDDGQSDAMNKGYRLSTGDIIVYLNSDDYFLPDSFASVVPYLEKGADFVMGKVLISYEDGSFRLNDPKATLAEMLKWWEQDSLCCNPAGYFYLRKVQETVGGFNVHNHYSMDYEFLLECAHRYTLTKIDATLGVHRRYQGTKTNDSYTNLDYVNHLYCTDRFVQLLDSKYQKAYKKHRNRYVKSVTEDKYILAIIADLRNSRYKSAVHSLLRFFLYSPLRIFYRMGRFTIKSALKS